MNLKHHAKQICFSLLVSGCLVASGLQAGNLSIHASRNNTIVQETEMIISGGLSQNKTNHSHRIVINMNHGHNKRSRKLLRLAKSKRGDRYVYGAVGPHKFDCSGFVRYVYAHGRHIMLPRTAQAQYMATKHKRHAKRGRLVFFGPSKRNISHVGICLNHTKMIDAQNKGVKIENIHAPYWHLQGFGEVK